MTDRPPHPQAKNFLDATINAESTWLELEGTIKLYRASVLRSQMELQQQLRDRLHGMLDVHMDHVAATEVIKRGMYGR